LLKDGQKLEDAKLLSDYDLENDSVVSIRIGIEKRSDELGDLVEGAARLAIAKPLSYRQLTEKLKEVEELRRKEHRVNSMIRGTMLKISITN
jgi:hypothetical protein